MVYVLKNVSLGCDSVMCDSCDKSTDFILCPMVSITLQIIVKWSLTEQYNEFQF